MESKFQQLWFTYGFLVSPSARKSSHFLEMKKSKFVQRSNTGASSKQLLSINSTMALEASILKVIMIPQLGFGCIISLQSKPSPTNSMYQLTMSSYPDYTCLTFKETMSKFDRRGFISIGSISITSL